VDELLGHTRTGGIATATTYLAVALGRIGHQVVVLYAGDAPREPMADEWARLYGEANVAVQMLHRSGTQVQPAYFARMLDVEAALRADPPDVVVTQDLAAPAYTTLRMRQLGFGFEHTLFVVYCHGGRRWVTDMARKVRVLPGAHAITILEQASVELADVAVSPSAYLLDWMRGEGWRVPTNAFVIPHFTRSAALEEPRPRAATNGGGAVERVAFFGRLEERKGLKPFAAGLNALEPELLGKIELEFIGAATPAWPPERIEALLSDRTKHALRRISFETRLDQPEALARLRRPGTLAVMPSHGETFSNAVYECLEHGIPFLASNAGAPAELVAAADRARVLFDATPAGVAAALRRALSNGDALKPARPAFEAGTARDRWEQVMQLQPAPRPRALEPDVSSDLVLVREEADSPDEECVGTLARAQSACGADVVTCGVRLKSGAQRLFLGDPGGLGLLANHYGTVALVRRSHLPDGGAAGDPWPLLARLTLDGASVVSIPRALAARNAPVPDVANAPETALQVVAEFELRLPDALRGLARLAAGLAAPLPAPPRRRTLLRKLLRR
jgi:glycosyltransferase involved in cell wall biosynthesis